MVMRALIRIMLVLVAAAGLEAAPAVLDFSRSHTIEDVRRSGLKIKLLAGYKGSRLAYVFEEERDVIVLLPGGRKISQRIKIAHIDEKDGILTHLDLRGGVMPQGQAYQVAGAFCDSFNLNHDKLEDWYKLNLGKQYSTEDLYLDSDEKYYPAVTLKAGPTFSQNYPWIICLLIKWNWTEHRGKDEEQTWRELPAPAIPEISLNPPSGMKYDIADDFKPFHSALNAAIDEAKEAKKMGAQGPGPSLNKIAAPLGTPVSKEPAPVAPASRWRLWALGGGVLLLVALWFFWRTYRREN